MKNFILPFVRFIGSTSSLIKDLMDASLQPLNALSNKILEILPEPFNYIVAILYKFIVMYSFVQMTIFLSKVTVINFVFIFALVWLIFSLSDIHILYEDGYEVYSKGNRASESKFFFLMFCVCLHAAI
jgi:hypothetical protein